MRSNIQTMSPEQVGEHDLARLRLFAGANLRVVADILKDCKVQTLAKDDVLLTPGATSRTLYLILRGRLRLHIGSLSSDPVQFVEAGDAVGETSLISERPSVNFAVADETTTVLNVEEEVFWSLVYSERSVSRNVLWMAAERLRMGANPFEDESAPKAHAHRPARNDALTGLYNRSAFEQLLQRQLARCNTSRRPLSLLYVAVNDVHRLVEEFGASAADHAVCAIARLFQDLLRATDIIGRLDKWRFAMSLSECYTDAAALAARRLCAEARETIITLPDGSILPPPTLTVGIAGSQAFADADALIHAARQALERALRQGVPVDVA